MSWIPQSCRLIFHNGVPKSGSLLSTDVLYPFVDTAAHSCQLFDFFCSQKERILRVSSKDSSPLLRLYIAFVPVGVTAKQQGGYCYCLVYFLVCAMLRHIR